MKKNNILLKKFSKGKNTGFHFVKANMNNRQVKKLGVIHNYPNKFIMFANLNKIKKNFIFGTNIKSRSKNYLKLAGLLESPFNNKNQ